MGIHALVCICRKTSAGLPSPASVSATSGPCRVQRWRCKRSIGADVRSGHAAGACALPDMARPRALRLRTQLQRSGVGWSPTRGSTTGGTSAIRDHRFHLALRRPPSGPLFGRVRRWVLWRESGERWWSWNTHHGRARSSDQSPPDSAWIGKGFDTFLDPTALCDALRFGPVTHGCRIDRPVLIVDA
jgi:hypothetical protein